MSRKKLPTIKEMAETTETASGNPTVEQNEDKQNHIKIDISDGKNSETTQKHKIEVLEINAEIYLWVFNLVKFKSHCANILREEANKISPRKLVQDVFDANAPDASDDTKKAFEQIESIRAQMHQIVDVNKMLDLIKQIARETELMSKTEIDYTLPHTYELFNFPCDATSLKDYMLAYYMFRFRGPPPEDCEPPRLSFVKAICYSNETFIEIDDYLFKLRAGLEPVFELFGIPMENKQTEKVVPSDWTECCHPKRAFVKLEKLDPILVIEYEDKIYETNQFINVGRFTFVAFTFLSYLLQMQNINDADVNYHELVKKISKQRVINPL